MEEAKKNGTYESGSEQEGDDGNFEGEFVPQKALKNKDYKDLLFGEKKKKNGADFSDDDPKINFLNGQSFSPKFYELLSVRKSLPAWQARQKISDLLQELQVVVLQGDTGSGKTTQVPQFLLQSGLANGKCIACT